MSVFKEQTEQERAEAQKRWEEQKAAAQKRQPKVRRQGAVKTR